MNCAGKSSPLSRLVAHLNRSFRVGLVAFALLLCVVTASCLTGQAGFPSARKSAVQLLGSWGGRVGLIVFMDSLAIVERGIAFEVIDFKDIYHPRVVARQSLQAEILAMAASGSFLALAVRDVGLQIWDLSNPSHPVLSSSTEIPYHNLSLEVLGHYAAISWGHGGAGSSEIYDFKNSRLLRKAVEIFWIYNQLPAVGDGVAYLAHCEGDVEVKLDVFSLVKSKPSSDFHQISQFRLDEGGDGCSSIVTTVEGTLLDVNVGGTTAVFDISVPSEPKLVTKSHGIVRHSRAGDPFPVVATLSDSGVLTVFWCGRLRAYDSVEIQNIGRNGFLVDGGRVFYLPAEPGSALTVFDPTTKNSLACDPSLTSVVQVQVAGSKVLVVDPDFTITLLDLSDARAVRKLGAIKIDGTKRYREHETELPDRPEPPLTVILKMMPDAAFVLTEEGLTAIDLSGPASPRQAGVQELKDEGLNVLTVDGNIACAKLEGGSLVTFDLTDPASPVATSRIPNLAQFSLVDVVDSTVYLAAKDKSVLGIDLSDPAAPAFAGVWPGDFGTYDDDAPRLVKAFDGDLLFNIAEASNTVGTYRYLEWGKSWRDDDPPHRVDLFDVCDPRDLAVTEEFLFVADREAGLLVFRRPKP